MSLLLAGSISLDSTFKVVKDFIYLIGDIVYVIVNKVSFLGVVQYFLLANEF